MVLRLWCGKLKLSKPYLGLATHSGNRWFCSRGAFSHHQHHHHHQTLTNNSTKIITLIERDVTGGSKWTQNPIAGQYRTVSSSFAQDDVTIETFYSLCNQGNSREAVMVLDYLENKGYAMDLIRLLRLAKLCGEPEALKEAKVVHECIIALVPLFDVSSRNAIIEMYSGCGSVNDELKAFDDMPEKNLETWCVMMRCFVNNGSGEKAIDLFTRSKKKGTNQTESFSKKSSLRVACDVHKGSLQFDTMRRDYGIVPSMEHYHSVTKMLATSGHLDEALNFVERMLMEPSVDVWETLMNLSRVHGHLELGDRCAELIEKLDATKLDKVSSASLVATKESDFVKEKQNYRSKPCYEFKTKDTSHPKMDTIYDTLKSLQSQMVEMGYVLDTLPWRRRIKNGFLATKRKSQLLTGY